MTSVEFALVATVFFFFVIGIFEVGRLLYGLSAMTNSAREGARYAIACNNGPGANPCPAVAGSTACQSGNAGMQSAATAASQGIPLTVTASETDTTINGTTFPYKCTVTATWLYKPLSGLLNVFPASGHTYTTSATLYFDANLQ